GADNRDPYTDQSLPVPFPDAVQELRIETSGLSALPGEATAVGVVTKSGTNRFHGDVFEFLSNDYLNARNFFAARRSALKRNQFGGTLGGPIKQNQLLFFAGYQGATLRQDSLQSLAFVPSAALAGDFTTYASGCTGRQIILRPPFVNNRAD